MSSVVGRFTLLGFISLSALIWMLAFMRSSSPGDVYASLAEKSSDQSILRENEYDLMKDEEWTGEEQRVLSGTFHTASRWIVVTSVAEPTEDVKRLASVKNWQLLVVGDKRTPFDWHLSGAIFLSYRVQQELGYHSLKYIPSGSYTRKNIGYLFAIQHGAEFIYDTDDDNRPSDRGLDEFDFSVNISGIRVGSRKSGNRSVEDVLFQPYAYFGVPSMWPRGFPLELVESHSNDRLDWKLCGSAPASVVQQGLVRGDPDVDAIYRLLNAVPGKELNVDFDTHAATVTLEPGLYAPWNSQNTLFQRRAFFGLLLPASVSFRTTDIWRGYFTQKLLHLAGLTISFVPPNAVQKRNAHSYLKDFDSEESVFLQSGELVEMLSTWMCNATTMNECAIQLADKFRERGMWNESDARLVRAWIQDLKKMNYKFPPLNAKSPPKDDCRWIQVHFDASEYREQQAIDSFAWLSANYCQPATAELKNPNLVWTPLRFPPVAVMRANSAKSEQSRRNRRTVLLLTSNHPWRPNIIPLLDRVLSHQYAATFYCGEMPDAVLENTREYSRFVGRPLNLINMTQEEVIRGILMYSCVEKFHQLRVRDYSGVISSSDDAMFSFWKPWNVSLSTGERHPVKQSHNWWRDWGDAGMKNAVTEIERIRKERSDPLMCAFWDDFERRTNKTVHDQYYIDHGNAVEDWYYIARGDMEVFTRSMHILRAGKTFLEYAVPYTLEMLPHYAVLNLSEVRDTWDGLRNHWDLTMAIDQWNGIRIFHPVKISQFNNAEKKYLYCQIYVLPSFKAIFDSDKR